VEKLTEKLRWKFEREIAAEQTKSYELKQLRGGKLGGDSFRDPAKKTGKRSDGKANDHHVWTLPYWKNPYGERHRIQAKPIPTQKQRLDSVMRVIGHPLSIMRKWPEVVGTANEISKAEIKEQLMAEQKAVAAHRAALEKTVEKLAARRDIVKVELDGLEAELKALLAMLRIAAPQDVVAEAIEGKNSKVKIPKPKAVSKKLKELSVSAKDVNDLARKLLADSSSKEPVTPDALGELTGQSNKNAAQTLARLARAGDAKRVGRGTYTGA